MAAIHGLRLIVSGQKAACRPPRILVLAGRERVQSAG
jgi:hypothetical protein